MLTIREVLRGVRAETLRAARRTVILGQDEEEYNTYVKGTPKYADVCSHPFFPVYGCRTVCFRGGPVGVHPGSAGHTKLHCHDGAVVFQAKFF